MNSAPKRMKSAATDTSVEIRNSAEWTALRARIVSNAAISAAMANIQKKTAAQPERVMSLESRVWSLESSQSGLSTPDSGLQTCLCFVLDRLASLLQHLAIPDEAGARVGGEFKVLRQFETRGRARLLAERAEHA